MSRVSLREYGLRPIGGIVASSVMIIIPELIFYGFFQKNIVEGMTAGAVKG